MNYKRFNKLLKKRLAQITTVLESKSVEYSTTSDKLYNFKRAAEVMRCSDTRALWGMYMKHFVSIQDIIEKIDNSGDYPPVELLEEKIGDAINYMILLEAIIKEKIE